jgi:lysozyme family protein
MSFFNEVYGRVMQHEGGYANNPADKGRETYAGISRRFHPNWQGWKDIDEIKKQQGPIPNNKIFPSLSGAVREFYRKHYWDAVLGEAYSDYALALQIFDTAVNCGVRTASKMLQRTLNVLNRRGRLWADIEADGIIGARTIEALNYAYVAGKANLVLNTFCILRGSYYIEIMERDETQEVWAEAWLSRLWVPRS